MTEQTTTTHGGAEQDRTPQDRTPLLEVKDLQVEFRTKAGTAKAINGLNFTLHAGETLAILGESGSGKSVTAQTIMAFWTCPRATSPEVRSATAARTSCRCRRRGAGGCAGWTSR